MEVFDARSSCCHKARRSKVILGQKVENKTTNNEKVL